MAGSGNNTDRTYFAGGRAGLPANLLLGEQTGKQKVTVVWNSNAKEILLKKTQLTGDKVMIRCYNSVKYSNCL